MPAKKSTRDSDADIASLISVLRDEPDRIFGCVTLRKLADVPKSIIRGLLTGHPSVNIIEGPKNTFKYQYRP